MLLRGTEPRQYASEAVSPLLATEALDLRPCAVEDFEELYRLWTHPDVRRFLFDERVLTPEEAMRFVERSDASFREEGYGLWLFFQRGEEGIAGFAGLLRAADGASPSLIFGTRPDLWGRGYAFQSASAVLAFAFETLGQQRVRADVDEPNAVSVRVLEKLGMKRSGRRTVSERPILDYEMTFAGWKRE
jgi:RimJ/RimL family protein N-acetyltransferase